MINRLMVIFSRKREVNHCRNLLVIEKIALIGYTVPNLPMPGVAPFLTIISHISVSSDPTLIVDQFLHFTPAQESLGIYAQIPLTVIVVILYLRQDDASLSVLEELHFGVFVVLLFGRVNRFGRGPSASRRRTAATGVSSSDRSSVSSDSTLIVDQFLHFTPAQESQRVHTSEFGI